MKAIDNKELILSLEELEKEKGIKKSYVIEAIETALVTAYKKKLRLIRKCKSRHRQTNRSNTCICNKKT